MNSDWNKDWMRFWQGLFVGVFLGAGVWIVLILAAWFIIIYFNIHV